MAPDTLLVKWMDQPMQVYRAANGYLSDAAKAAGRTPPAHPEGYLEAFANIYKNFANAIRAKQAGKKLAKDDVANDYPKIEDGVRGMAFIEAVVASSKANAAWTPPVPRSAGTRRWRCRVRGQRGLGIERLARQWAQRIAQRNRSGCRSRGQRASERGGNARRGRPRGDP